MLAALFKHQDVCKLWNNNLYVGLIISAHIDKTHEKGMKKKQKKWLHSLSILVIGDRNYISVYYVSIKTWIKPWTKIESHAAIITQPEESKEKL